MDGGTIAAIVIGLVWVSVAITATLLQPYVRDDEEERPKKGAHRAAPTVPSQRSAPANEISDVRQRG